MIDVLVVERLQKRHIRDQFDCGEPSLDDFLKRYARQNDDTGVGRTFVACPAEANRVLGYYTIAAGSISFSAVPPQDRLPRYPVPVAHIARLAVDRSVRRQGVGAHLLIDALKRIRGLSAEIAIYAVTVDALNDAAVAFYRHYGFEPLRDDPRHLFMTMRRIAGLP